MADDLGRKYFGRALKGTQDDDSYVGLSAESTPYTSGNPRLGATIGKGGFSVHGEYRPRDEGKAEGSLKVGFRKSF